MGGSGTYLPLSRFGLEQTVHSGSVELSQAGILRGAGVVLGTPPKLLEAVLEFGQAP